MRENVFNRGDGSRKRIFRFTLCLLLAMMLFISSGFPACATGNLEERFSYVPRLEWEGGIYYLRPRLTCMLLTGFMRDDSAAPRADFIMLAAIDDNNRTITPITIDSALPVDIGDVTLPLSDVCAAADVSEEGMNSMVEAINSLLGAELITQHMGIDLTGMSAVINFNDVPVDARARLRYLWEALKNFPSGERNALYNAVSAYLITDMKSGDVMRAADKAERYEIADEIALPLLPSQDGGARLPDEAAIRELLIELFFDDELF